MRLGPGKHLHGKELFGGIVKGEEFDYFQYVESIDGHTDGPSLMDRVARWS